MTEELAQAEWRTFKKALFRHDFETARNIGGNAIFKRHALVEHFETAKAALQKRKREVAMLRDTLWEAGIHDPTRAGDEYYEARFAERMDSLNRAFEQ